MDQRPPTRWIDGLAVLADRYDGFAIDQFGVLHDGRRPYDGAIDALEQLRAYGKRVVLLSNSGRRASVNAARLASLGFDAMRYDALITSGELLHELLGTRDAAPFATLGTEVYLMNPSGDQAVIDGLGLHEAATPANAQWVLLATLGELGAAHAVHALDTLLDDAASRRLPMVCANPDLLSLTARGVEPSTGAIASRYRARGGRVHWVGKPHRPIYEACAKLMAAWGVKRVVAIGDSPDHDVAGAQAFGWEACFIAGGIHSARFAAAKDLSDPARDGALKDLCAAAEAAHRDAFDPLSCAPPAWAMQTLRWSQHQ